MTKAKQAAPKRPISAKQRKAIGTAYAIGLSASASFASAVTALRTTFVAADKEALIEFGLGYKAGYMFGYLCANVPGFAKRKGNQTPELIDEDMRAIYAKPYPESTKPNRRTDVEHKACRAADVSWHSAKTRAGLTVPKKRKPRPSANDKEPPRSLLAVVPTLADKAAANDYGGQAAAALLATVNANAKRFTPQLSSLIEDFHKGCKALGLIVELAK